MPWFVFRAPRCANHPGGADTQTPFIRIAKHGRLAASKLFIKAQICLKDFSKISQSRANATSPRSNMRRRYRILGALRFISYAPNDKA
jgi:hypothetical protein